MPFFRMHAKLHLDVPNGLIRCVTRERKKERGAQTKSMNTHKKRMRADKKSERKQHTSRLQLNPVSMNADRHTFISVFGMQIELKLRL